MAFTLLKRDKPGAERAAGLITGTSRIVDRGWTAD